MFLPGWYLYQYLDGKRRRYSSPIRFYLLAVFVCVLALGWRVDRAAKVAIDSSQLLVESDGYGGFSILFGDGDDAEELRADRARADADRVVRVALQEMFEPICVADVVDVLPWNATSEPYVFDWVASMTSHSSESCILEGDGPAQTIGVALIRLLQNKTGAEATSQLVGAALEQVPLAMSVMIGVFALLLKLAWWREPTTVHVLTSVVLHALALYGLTLLTIWPSLWTLWLIGGWLQAHILFSLRAAYPSGYARIFASWVVLFVLWVPLALAALVLCTLVGLYRLSAVL